MARRRRKDSRRRRRQRKRPERQTLFYAYPASPSSLGETISSATSDLSLTREAEEANLRFMPWPDLQISGRPLISQITEHIRRSSVFACDVTYLNDNVAFELGFAIGIFKRVWLSLDRSIEGAPFGFKGGYTGMLGIGYAGYENHKDLAKSLLTDSPWNSIDQCLLGDSYRDREPRSEHPALFYVMLRFERIPQSPWGSNCQSPLSQGT